jgi:hypothetical protein
MRYFVSFKTIPESASYLGSTEGAHTISESVADAIDEAAEPAYTKDQDGTRHFFDLQPGA